MESIYKEILILVAVIYSIAAFFLPAVVSWDTGISYSLLMSGFCSYLWVPLAVTLGVLFVMFVLSGMHKMHWDR